MTFVIAKKELIEKLNDNQNLNSFVSFYIKPYDIPVVGVHSDNAYEMLTYLNKISFRPKILIGDFNSGNYLKDDQEKDRAIKSNRINYLFVSEGYIDMCQGKYTLAYYKTQIDHILVENRNSFLERLTYENATVDYQFKCSDHYPICWKFEISEM